MNLLLLTPSPIKAINVFLTPTITINPNNHAHKQSRAMRISIIVILKKAHHQSRQLLVPHDLAHHYLNYPPL